jgi:mono/diheme cytochrome c family protein
MTWKGLVGGKRAYAPPVPGNEKHEARRHSRVLLGRALPFLAAGVAFAGGCQPLVRPRARPTTSQTFEVTEQRLARGKYLAENVCACMECHTPHDWTKPVSPLTPGMIGAGEAIPLAGLPGRVVAPNLTPDRETGAGSWTDDQFARAIREGIGHDGRALFPAMPYRSYRALSDEDMASVILYLRSLPPVRNPLPRTRLSIPAKFVILGMPQPLRTAVPEPDDSTPEKRGAYLAAVGACIDCHTPINRLGRRLPGMDFAGGYVLAGPFGRVASANLTPDASGIPYYDLALFTNAMRAGSVGARPINPVMPWTTYRGMTDGDLADLFAYLRTLPPVRHRVDNTETPAYCPICKMRHGAGKTN